jgi:hypothetical protein
MSGGAKLIAFTASRGLSDHVCLLADDGNAKYDAP